jgi:enoyl-CoA hydratase/carnithine racemase
VVVTEPRDSAFLIGLQRPEKRNALDEEMVDQLHAALQEAAREPCVVIVHSLVPKVFVSGADIAELLRRDADAALRSININLFDRLEAHRWPTIAAVDGWALGGGCELALACDFRLASSTSVFGQPEADLGIIAGAGGNWRLPQLVGLSLARRMLLAGERLDAAQALAAGLVDQVHPSDGVLDAALDLARQMGRRSWRSLELTKLALRQHRPATAAFDQVAQALAFESEDKRTRLQAFLDRPKGR